MELWYGIYVSVKIHRTVHTQRILSYVNKRKFNYDVEGTEDGRQTVRNDFNCISSEWHSHPKAARNERSSGLSNFEKQCFDWIM